MDPYYKIKFEGKSKKFEIKGEKHFGGGKNPEWNDFDSSSHWIEFEIDEVPHGNVEITLKNDSSLLCCTTMDIQKIIQSKGNQWVDTYTMQGKKSGCFKMTV